MKKQSTGGYSARVDGFLFVPADARRGVRLAKTNDAELTFAETCHFPPGTIGALVVTIDGTRSRREIILPDGITAGQTVARYEAR